MKSSGKRREGATLAPVASRRTSRVEPDEDRSSNSTDSDSITTLFVPLAIAHAEALGINVAPLAARYGIPPTRPDEHIVLRPQQIQAIGEALEPLLGDPFYALKLGTSTPRGVYGIIEFAIAASSTLGQAMERFTRYFRIVNDRGVLEVETDGDEYVFSAWIPGSPEAAGRHYNDYVLGFVLNSLRQFTGVKLFPTRVELIHERPARVDVYREVFGDAGILFGSQKNVLVFDVAVTALPQRSADPDLLRVLDKQLEQSLPVMPTQGQEDDLRRIELAIANSLRDGTPSLLTVARRLHTSSRTLQRQLRERSTTFYDLVEKVRHDLARRYFERDALTPKQVAFLLGYSDPRAFRRAFLRWESMTPSDFLRKR